MSRRHLVHHDIIALFGLLGWRPGNDADDLAHMNAAARPSRIRAADILARITAGIAPEEEESAAIRPFRNPVAAGFARAARNGSDIPPHIEARMRVDRAQAKQAKQAKRATGRAP